MAGTGVIEKEEWKVFSEMFENCSPTATPSVKKVYNHFIKAWNKEFR